MKNQSVVAVLLMVAIFLVYCDQKSNNETVQTEAKKEQELLVVSEWGEEGRFELNIPQTGRYKVILEGSTEKADTFWLEDYVGNEDGRQYNVTGNMILDLKGTVEIDGSPLAEGKHSMKLHGTNLSSVSKLSFLLIQRQQITKKSLKQNMSGNTWKLVWSDEFETEGLPDTTKWAYNIGNWGWGNNELQYYTNSKAQNARIENGNLIVEAHPLEDSERWTSARLTTQGKTSFLYGKIEFRAKVPKGLGTWAAGWLLGDSYQDELSWPYCGEIDVLECVGFEINEEGFGKNHSSCHTPAYYFKKGNQITSEIPVDSMDTEYHLYSVEWYPDRVEAFLDGEHYYTYDKTANALEWPFTQPQNIIINLAIGGGWGGLMGVDTNMGSQQYIVDYVRVYEKVQ